MQLCNKELLKYCARSFETCLLKIVLMQEQQILISYNESKFQKCITFPTVML